MAFPPTPTLAQAACPTIPTWSAFYDLSSGPLVSPTFSQGETSNLRSKLNEGHARIDANARYGGGGWGVIPGPAGTGCNLSAGSGLSLNIAAGEVFIDGNRTVNAHAVTLTDNISRIYLWCSQAGAITQVNNSLTPPAGAQVFCGSAVTSGGAITSVDFSGVVYLVGGGAGIHRFTTDTTTPGDTPPSTMTFQHHGTGISWIWTGATYKPFSAASSANPLALAATTTVGTSQAWSRADHRHPRDIVSIPVRLATATWTNMPASATAFLGLSIRTPYDTTQFSEARLIVEVSTAGAATPAKLRAFYSTTSGGAAVALDGGSGPSVNIDSTGYKESAWATLAAGAKGSIFVQISGIDGDGSADPVFESVVVQFR